MIRKAIDSDVDAIESSYNELLDHEEATVSYTNWRRGGYPTRETAALGLAAGTLYVLEVNGELCGSMILNHEQPWDHEKLPWKHPASGTENLTVHTLCVPPSKAGHGYGRQLMEYAIAFAKECRCKVMRLDTYMGNEPAMALYRSLGFTSPGTADVVFGGVIKETQRYFEKLLL